MGGGRESCFRKGTGTSQVPNHRSKVDQGRPGVSRSKDSEDLTIVMCRQILQSKTVSADRSDEAAQVLTTSWLVRKSSIDNSVWLHCMWGYGHLGEWRRLYPMAPRSRCFLLFKEYMVISDLFNICSVKQTNYCLNCVI